MSEVVDLRAGYWDSLARTVGATVDAGRIGAPKALRLTVHVHAPVAVDAANARARAESAASRCAASWFKGEACVDYGVGDSRLAAARLMVWPGGQSALLAVSAGRGVTAGNLVLMGSHGSIYHRIAPTSLTEPKEAL